MLKIKLVFLIIGLSFFSVNVFSQEKNEVLIPVEQFYQYDKKALLNAKENVIEETKDYVKYHVTYSSVNDKIVTAVLTVPKTGKPPYPVIIFQHGLSENKYADQVWFGSQKLVLQGYAVFTIDADEHGERAKDKSSGYAASMMGKGQLYNMRNMFIQTAIDIRRGIDYLSKKNFINKEKIGYAGISMGGLIGVLVSAVDTRIKAAVFIVAGGNFLKMISLLAVFPDAAIITKTIDPIYFIKKISPRPLLMINGLQDTMFLEPAKELFATANEPKKIVWIDADHIGVPFKEETIKNLLEFYQNNLK